MPVRSMSFTQSWFSRDMKEYISVDVDGEFILARMGTPQSIKLGSTLEEMRESLEKTGKIANFPDFI